MSVSLQFDQRSVKALHVNLNVFPQRFTRIQLIKGLNAAGTPAKTAAQTTAARETGLLAKSMVIKVPRDKRTKVPLGVIIGPSRKVKRFVRGGKVLGPKKAQKLMASGASLRLRKPTQYAHHAERVSPAIYNAQKALETAGMARLHSKLTEGLSQEAAALPK